MAGPLEERGTFAGAYRVERLLAQGGMGCVYVATQLATGRQRALKVMRADLVTDPKHRQRFEQEAKVGAAIASDHVVEVIDAGVDAATGMPWLAMELLDGESLADLVARTGPLPAATVERVLGDIAHAVAAAHRVGVVHRDLKPENVFVANPRRRAEPYLVKVLDFGIAKVVANARATGTAAIGTLLWMAPEQTERDGAVGPATDVWSLALIAFFVLTGRTFWDDDASPMTVVKKLVVDPIPAASARARDVGAEERLPPGFDAWFARCTARDPNERLASVEEAMADLRHILAERPAAPPLAATALAPAVVDRGIDSLARTEPDPAAVAPTALHAADPSLAATEPSLADSIADHAASRVPRRAAAALVALLVVAAAALVLTRAFRDPSRSAPPTASGSVLGARTAALKLSADDEVDHDTVWRVPLGTSPRRGGKEPLLTIVEFGDFECPFTRAFDETVRRILEKYGDDVAVIWKHLVPDHHWFAGPALRVALLARAELGEEGFWKAHDRLFGACASADRGALVEVGRELGLTSAKVKAALDGPMPPEVDRDMDLAFDLGQIRIPAYFINGHRAMSNSTFERLAPLLERELARARGLVAAGVPRARLYDELQKDAVAIQPMKRKNVDLGRLRSPVLAGAHAVVDVHQFGDETDMFTGIGQGTVDWMIRAYGDRIRFHWHWGLGEDAGPASLRVAAVSEAVYLQNGDETFWKFHRGVMENAVWPFPVPQRDPRGLSDPVLVDLGKAAGANLMYLGTALNARVEPNRWDEARRLRAQVHELNPTIPLLYADGYAFGTYQRLVQRILDQLIAEKSRTP